MGCSCHFCCVSRHSCVCQLYSDSDTGVFVVSTIGPLRPPFVFFVTSFKTTLYLWNQLSFRSLSCLFLSLIHCMTTCGFILQSMLCSFFDPLAVSQTTQRPPVLTCDGSEEAPWAHPTYWFLCLGPPNLDPLAPPWLLAIGQCGSSFQLVRRLPQHFPCLSQSFGMFLSVPNSQLSTGHEGPTGLPYNTLLTNKESSLEIVMSLPPYRS
jgi:hypothetical protein